MLAASLLAALPTAPAPTGGARPALGLSPAQAEADRAPEGSAFAEALAALMGMLGQPTPASAPLAAPSLNGTGSLTVATGDAAVPQPSGGLLVGLAAPEGAERQEVPGGLLLDGTAAEPPAAVHAFASGTAIKAETVVQPATTLLAAPANPPPPAVATVLRAAEGSPLALTGVRRSEAVQATSPAGEDPSPPNAAVAAPAIAPAAGAGAGGASSHEGGSPGSEPPVDTAAAPPEPTVPESAGFEPILPTETVEGSAPAAPPRANAETVAALAAEVARKLDAKVTRFELQLDPAGLGQVQVALEIRAGGDVSAHLSFERPDTMQDLRARAEELREALKDAGFSVAGGALSFDGGGERRSAPERSLRPVAPTFTLLDAEPTPAPARPAFHGRSAVDLRI
jgi:hypothetical protein